MTYGIWILLMFGVMCFVWHIGSLFKIHDNHQPKVRVSTIICPPPGEREPRKFVRIHHIGHHCYSTAFVYQKEDIDETDAFMQEANAEVEECLRRV